MAASHDLFKALGPVEYTDFAQQDLKETLSNIFGDAQCLIDSIPVNTKSESQKTGRSRAVTDSAVDSLPITSAVYSDQAAQLRKEWKEVKVNPKENPLGLNVYKLGAKDGRGAWFARRSVHEAPSFDRWREGFEREFEESLKIQGHGPGEGKVRGLAADKRVVDQTVDGCGKIQVYQLSAQFPGPTSPRDFVTMCLNSNSSLIEGAKQRYHMLVSKPCTHSECPQRTGFIRGYYESVEFIREIKIDKPLRKVQSSTDITGKNAPTSLSNALDGTSDDAGKYEENEEYDTAVEWLMITRSDPGGSVPRFMIERGTPPGIAGDANKFLQWITSEKFESVDDTETTNEATPDIIAASATTTSDPPGPSPTSSSLPLVAKSSTSREELEDEPGPSGYYGMIAGALGAAASIAASRLPRPFGSAIGGDTPSEVSSTDISDAASSIHTFHSLEDEKDVNTLEEEKELSPSVSTSNAADSTPSSEPTNAKPSQHEKELKKLEERKRKTEEKMRRQQERSMKKNDGAALQKLRERHEREIAKQEEKYARDRVKLEAKRLKEEKKGEDRRRKAAEREEKANLVLELEKTRTERDMARLEIEMLRDQVGQLQAQNTKLTAQLGRAGLSVEENGPVERADGEKEKTTKGL
ncbi:hypothetical protein GGR57DRAFT_446958 [Xylariaceae sp. FL1272]|nr:hypothetical protein GGR57DRAFT_446958 [Xylariaceae sp. FL1272]